MTAPQTPLGWDVRIARKRRRLPESEYREALARGEIQKTDATADIVRGEQLIAQVQELSGTRQCMLAFSCGKDSIAAWIAIRPHFDRVTPYYMYGVPDLSFVQESIRYYERELFDEPVIQMPHPSFYLQLHHCIFQTPDRIAMLRAANLGNYDHDAMRELIIEEAKLPPTTMIATGLRARDNTMRRMAIVTYGPINRSSNTFWPIWDWDKARVVDTIKREKLHLPVDYDLFGRTWDGICAEDLIPIKKHFPKDYEKILEWFPLADIELFRLQRYAEDPLDGESLSPYAEDSRQAPGRREVQTRGLPSPGDFPGGR